MLHSGEAVRRALIQLGVALAVAACSSKPNGALVVAIETDVPLPKDVDTVELQVEADGSVQFDNSYPVGQGALLVPATITLLPGSNASEPVTIRLLAYQNGAVRMLRETITTVPTTRIATLLMPIEWLDFGMTSGGSQMNPSAVTSTCPSRQTPSEGSCISETVDSSTLPDYVANALFGGGDGTGNGTCFDLLGCFAASTVATVKTEGCTMADPGGSNVNVALVVAASADGECDSHGCFVPVPYGAPGWTRSNGTIALPPAVCKDLASGRVSAVRVSTSCASASPTSALCGPWSSVSVGTPWGGNDAGPDVPMPPQEAGTVTAFAATSASQGVVGIVAGPDHAVWFAEFGANKIGRMATDGGVTEYPVSGSPFGIVVGPDGALWFTEQNGNTIGRVSTGGSVREFPLPTTLHDPAYIAAGPDKALWFTAIDESTQGDTIGRIALDGGASEFLAPASIAAATIDDGITAGPDGALWFTESGANTIVRMSTDGGVTEYPVTTPEAQPSLITLGPDGALWFVELGANQVGRITTDGGLIEYPVAASALLQGITTGPDGQMWISGNAPSSLYRVTLAGTVTPFSVPFEVAGGLQGLATGSDGNLWLANGSVIDRVVP